MGTTCFNSIDNERVDKSDGLLHSTTEQEKFVCAYAPKQYTVVDIGRTMNMPEVQGEYQFVSQIGIQYTNHTNSS